MILYMYAVRDRATDMFANPMFLVSNGQAIRSFSDEVNRVPTNGEVNYIGQHPDDFDLYLLGQFDTSTGLFDSGPPQQIAIGKNLKLNNGKG